MMIRRRALLTTLLFVLVFSIASPLLAQSLGTHVTDYFIATNIERSRYDEILWYYQSDFVVGPIRTNTAIGVKNNPRFYSDVYMSSQYFIEGSGFNPQLLGSEPQFDVPVLQALVHPHAIADLAEVAATSGHYFGNEGGEWQSRVYADEGHWTLYQWDADDEYSPSREFYTIQTIPYQMGSVIFVEGRLEVAGNHVKGMTTIACDSDMYLVDDIVYEGYSQADILPVPSRNGDQWLVPNRDHLLALVAQNDILVANTPANGRGNGAFQGDEDDFSNKNILITAAMYAESGEFTIENHNNAPFDPNGWDGYWWCEERGDHSGETDERGTIYLHGSVAANRHGYVHRSNCSGTGYGKHYYYDHRFRGADFPGLYDLQLVDLNETDVTFQDTVISIQSAEDRLYMTGTRTLVLGPGTTIQIDFDGNLWDYAFWGGQLRMEGTEENPVRIEITASEMPDRPLALFYNTEMGLDWQYASIVSDVPLDLMIPMEISHVRLEAPELHLNGVRWMNGNFIRDCVLRGEVTIDADYGVDHFERNVVEGSLSATMTRIDHCTFVYRPDYGTTALAFTGSANYPDTPRRVTNTVFEGAYRDLFTVTNLGSIDYSAWHGTNGGVSFPGTISVGENNLVDQDPLFWDTINADYHLQANSPLIDAGDPDSPLDPDGSRSDIGAFAYDPTYMDAPEGFETEELPGSFALEPAWPNPFNGMTSVTLTLPKAADVDLQVYDLLGREVAKVQRGRLSAGRHTFSINLSSQPSGLYFITAQNGMQSTVIKAMLVK